VLAPDHGLPSKTRSVLDDCWIPGERGLRYLIVDILRPEDSRVVLAGDWAVLLVDSRRASPAARLRIGQVETRVLRDFVADEIPVRQLLSVASSDQANCTLKRDARYVEEIAVGLFMHSCRSWPGLSGAPMLVEYEGEPIVIGFNIGRRMKAVGAKGPLFIGIGRAVDAEIAAAINDAARRVRELSGP
jgi:hypothetical protein